MSAGDLKVGDVGPPSFDFLSSSFTKVLPVDNFQIVGKNCKHFMCMHIYMYIYIYCDSMCLSIYLLVCTYAPLYPCLDLYMF